MKMIRHQYLKNVVTLDYDREKCTGCGICQQVCPQGVYKIEDRKAVIQDKDWCMECGACVRNCAFAALGVRSGVGCAYGILIGKLRGTEPCCD
jgi:NAD-dependent dihydropyrimidine dehydrogenase PreA subunit